MRTMRRARLGAALLYAAAFLAGCANSGPRPEVLTKSEVVEAAKLQYVPIPTELTAITPLPDLPTPTVFGSPDCAAGCYSNAQLSDALDTCMANRGTHIDRLRAIKRLSDDAAGPKSPPSKGKPP